MVTPAGLRKRARGALWFFAGLLALAILLLWAAHSRPVREYALRRAVATLESGYQIRLQARGVDYNLLALRVTLNDVHASSASAGARPFFSARRLTVQLPTDAVFGPFAIDTIAIEDGRVEIVREAGGRTNLPESKGDDREPAPLRLGSLIAPRLAVEVFDRASDSGLVLSSLDLKLSPSSGRIDLREAGRLFRGDVATLLRRGQGGVAFDGQGLQLSSVTIESDEGAATIGGAIALLVREPAIDLRIRGHADSVRLARWGSVPDPPRATVEFSAIVKGPLAAPQVEATVKSSRVDWRGVLAEELTAFVRTTPDLLEVQNAAVKLAGGSIAASASMALKSGDTHVHASAQQLDLDALRRMFAPRLTVRPSGVASGTLEAPRSSGRSRGVGGAGGPGRHSGANGESTSSRGWATDLAGRRRRVEARHPQRCSRG